LKCVQKREGFAGCIIVMTIILNKQSALQMIE